MNGISDRFVDLVFKIRAGDFDEVRRLADLSGLTITSETAHVLYVSGRVTTAIYSKLDPVTLFIVLGLAFFGEYWVDVMPDGLEKVNWRWRKEIKEQKEKRGKKGL